MIGNSLGWVICSYYCWLIVPVIFCDFTGAFSGEPQSSKNPLRVLVTGAAGKTGRIVLSKLEEDNRYEPKGLFRTEQSARMIVKNDDTKCPLEHVVIADVTSPTFLDDLAPLELHQNHKNHKDGKNEVEKAEDTKAQIKIRSNGLENIDAMIICTSAVPRIRKRSLAAMLVKAPWRMLSGKPIMNIHSMRFGWKHGGYPEKVDYLGQKAQIDLAKRLGIPHVVLVSSMGGTDPENFLNSVGKRTGLWEKEGHGDILSWKRRAEEYLVESGLDYTILHPGGLVDTPGGKDDFVFGVDDKLYELNHHHPNPITRISRDDIAELCIASLSVGKGRKASFDCITMPSSLLSSFTTRVTSTQELGIFSSSFAKETNLSALDASTETTVTASVMPTISDSTERISAEEALRSFLDLAIATNYHSDLHP